MAKMPAENNMMQRWSKDVPDGERSVLEQFQRADAELQTAKTGATAALENTEKQEAVIENNSGMSIEPDAVTGIIGAQSNVAVPLTGGLLGKLAGKAGKEGIAKAVQPAVTTREQAEESDKQLSLLRASYPKAPLSMIKSSSYVAKQTAGEPDDSRLKRLAAEVDSAQQNAKTKIKIAELNRAHYTANGDPFLTYFYNKFAGTTDPNVANAMSYYQECNRSYESERQLYEAELKHNDQKMQAYLKGKDDYFKNAAIHVQAASRLIGSQDIKYLSPLQQEDFIHKEKMKMMDEYAKEMRTRYENGKDLDIDAVPGILNGMYTAAETGQMTLQDYYAIADKIVSNPKNLNLRSQKLAESLRRGKLGYTFNDDAVKASLIIANNEKLRNDVLRMREINKLHPDGKTSTGLEFMYSAFNDKDIAYLGDLLEIWERERGEEERIKERAAQYTVERLGSLSDYERQVFVAGLPTDSDRASLNDVINQGDFPVPSQLDMLSADKDYYAEKGTAEQKLIVHKLNGGGYDNAPMEVRNEIIDNALKRGTFKAFGSPYIDTVFQKVKSMQAEFLGAIDAITSAKDSAGRVEKILELKKKSEELAKSGDLAGSMLLSRDANMWNKMIKDAQAVDNAAFNLMWKTNEKMLREATRELAIHAFNREPIVQNGKVIVEPGNTLAGLFDNAAMDLFLQTLNSNPDLKDDYDAAYTVWKSSLARSSEDEAFLLMLGYTEEQFRGIFNGYYTAVNSLTAEEYAKIQADRQAQADMIAAEQNKKLMKRMIGGSNG